MAFSDNALTFSNAQAVTSTAASTTVYDITGAGSGTVPALVWGTTTAIGADMGAGDNNRPNILFTSPVAFVSGGGATMQIQIQAAPDAGDGTGNAGTYYTLWQSTALSVAQLATIVTTPFSVPLPPIDAAYPAGLLPRFYRINYVVATSTFSAGKITAQLLLNPPMQVNVQYPANFTSV